MKDKRKALTKLHRVRTARKTMLVAWEFAVQQLSTTQLLSCQNMLWMFLQARAELSDLQGGPSGHEDSGELEVSPLPEDPSTWKVQLSFFGAAVLPVLWFWSQAETPALSRKVISCILFPVSACTCTWLPVIKFAFKMYAMSPA